MLKKSVIYFFMALCTYLTLAGSAAFARSVSLENNQLILTPTHGGDGSAWGQVDCKTCHVRRNIHQTEAAAPIREIVLNTGYDGCTGCHGQNGTNAQRQCVLCHNTDLLPVNPIMDDIKNHNFIVGQDNALSDANCISCHQSSDMDGNFEVTVDLTHFPQQGNTLDLPYRNQTDFCLRCHNLNEQQPGFEMSARYPNDPLVAMKRNYQLIDMHGVRKGSGKRTYSGLRQSDYQYGILVECTDCHVMHGTHNEKLMMDRTDTAATLLDPVLRNKPITVYIEGGNYAQHCVVCHESEKAVEDTQVDTGNGLNGVHRASGSCVECHTHGMAVQTGL